MVLREMKIVPKAISHCVVILNLVSNGSIAAQTHTDTIQKQHGGHGVVPARVMERHAELIEKELAVGQTREGIVIRDALDTSRRIHRRLPFLLAFALTAAPAAAQQSPHDSVQGAVRAVDVRARTIEVTTGT